LLTPWHVRTYHDLFRNVGFEVEREARLEEEEGDEPMETVLSLFRRPG
jgi:hypothetical protein